MDTKAWSPLWKRWIAGKRSLMLAIFLFVLRRVTMLWRDLKSLTHPDDALKVSARTSVR
jgi:hypothetical protein